MLAHPGPPNTVVDPPSRKSQSLLAIKQDAIPSWFNLFFVITLFEAGDNLGASCLAIEHADLMNQQRVSDPRLF